jgi:uncharacterized protein YjbI with pentapeptide repeats
MAMDRLIGAGAALATRWVSPSGRPLFAAGCLLAVLLAVGCGSSESNEPEVEGPLPVGSDVAQAYIESFLADNPRAELQPEHLVVVHLEPDGDADDTCPQRDGVDCLSYIFEEETLLTFSTDNAPEELEQMVLRDGAGAAVLRQTAGSAPTSALIPAGEYVLELYHVFAGDNDAAEPVVFLQPHESDEAETTAALAALVPDGVQPSGTGMRGMTLSASRDCIRCNFANSELIDQRFDGLTLTESKFDGARMSKTSFRGASMADCSLRDLRKGPALQNAVDADFTGATLSRSSFSFLASYVGIFFNAVFNGARLDETVWESVGTDQNLCKGHLCSVLNPDFRNANLRGARFPAMRFHNLGFGTHRCTFQGADLSYAGFRPTFPRTSTDLSMCRFDREPESGRITSFRNAALQQVHASDADFSDADFTNALFSNANFGAGYGVGDTHTGCTLIDVTKGPRGAVMRRANFTGATLAGSCFAGADLTDAIFAAIPANSFADIDLRSANLAGADFAGSDLSRVNLGVASPFNRGAPNFAGAVLTNGTRGVDLTGQDFPSRYAGFKGLDLTAVNLTNTDLHEADLEGTTLNNAQLVGANLNFANLRRAKLRGATLGVEPGRERSAASLRGALMTDIDLSDADLRSVNLTAAHLYGDVQQTLLIRTRLDSANFSKAVCSGARFSGSLSNAVFVGAQLVNTIFNGATLTNTKFDDAYLHGADFSAASGVTGASLSNAAVSAAPGTWSFTEQDGTPFTIRYEATKLGPLATDPMVRCPNGSHGPCCPSGDVMQCLTEKLKPVGQGPHPPVPPCVPRPPRFNNCITPLPTATLRPTPTATPQR